MIIDFRHAEEYEQYDIDARVPLDNALLNGRGTFKGDAKLSGTYLVTGDNLVVDARLTAEADTECDRCGAPVVVSLDVPVREIFFKEHTKGLEPDSFFAVDDKADLSPLIRERVILAIPTQVLCDENCKGLCPRCGANLNHGKCNCNIDTVRDDNPFAVLKNMNTSSGGATNGSTKKKNE